MPPEFDALLAQAIAAPVMPFTPGNSLDAVRADPDKRNEQYRAVGLFITQHCNVLIALWDGDDKDMAAGGTAEVVTFKRHGIPLAVTGSARASLDASEIGPVIHVVTPRVKGSQRDRRSAVRPWGREIVAPYRSGPLRTAFHKLSARLAHPFRARRGETTDVERETWETFEALTALTRQFNREASALMAAAGGAARTGKSSVQLFGNPGEAEPIDSCAAQQRTCELAPRWCALCSIADTLAQERQTRFRRDWIYLFLFAFVGLICFDVFSHFLAEDVPLADALLVGYSLAFFFAFMLFRAASKGQHQERFLDYRALAEALRVAVFWKLVGVGSPRLEETPASHVRIVIRSVAEAYPIRQPSELAWVKVCLRNLDLLDAAARSPHPLSQADHLLARSLWVYGQYRYFLRQGLRHDHTAESWEDRWISVRARAFRSRVCP